MSQWHYGMLNMDGVQPQRESNALKPGRHVCKITKATVEPTRSGTYQVAIDLAAVDGSGKTFDRITVHHPRAQHDENAAKSVEIGRERLMAILTYGGHPNPAQHRDVRELVGLVVGVNCEQDEDWTDSNGVVRKGGVKPKKNGAYFAPEGGSSPTGTSLGGWDGGPATGAAQSRGSLDDEIPF